jgi:hypothetical protein
MPYENFYYKLEFLISHGIFGPWTAMHIRNVVFYKTNKMLKVSKYLQIVWAYLICDIMQVVTDCSGGLTLLGKDSGKVQQLVLP